MQFFIIAKNRYPMEFTNDAFYSGAKCVLSSRTLNALKGVKSTLTPHEPYYSSRAARVCVMCMGEREADRWAYGCAYVRYHVPGEAK